MKYDLVILVFNFLMTISNKPKCRQHIILDVLTDAL